MSAAAATLRLGMARVMQFDAFREKALATSLTAARQSRPPALGAHAGAESVLTLARAFGRLIGAFHR